MPDYPFIFCLRSILQDFNKHSVILQKNMESIRKQSMQSSVIQITGAFIGALNTLFIYPLDLGLYGIYGFLTNTASLLVPFISLGFGAVLLKYFPYFNDPKNKHQGFFGFIISGYATGILIFTLVFVLAFPWIISFFTKDDSLSAWYVIYILPVTILYVIFEMFTNFSINFQKISMPALAVFLMKIFLPFIFILSVHKYLDKLEFVWMICFYYLGVIIMLIIYLLKLDKLKIRFDKSIFTHSLRNPMMRFAIFSLLGGTSAMLALRIDSILITSIKGIEANGLFTLAIFISNVAFIPASALTDGLNALVSSISKEGNKPILQSMYSRSSINMLIPTLWIGLCIYLGFNSLSQIMPNAEKIILIHPVLAWLLLARIVDAATGVNHHILSYSKYYPIELYLLVLLAVLNIIFNVLLIPDYGIQGAAFATFVSVFIFNSFKTFLVYVKLGIHPFTHSHWKIILVGTGILLLFMKLNFSFHPLVNLLILSISISGLFLAVLFYLRVSMDFNLIIQRFLRKIIELRMK